MAIGDSEQEGEGSQADDGEEEDADEEEELDVGEFVWMPKGKGRVGYFDTAVCKDRKDGFKYMNERRVKSKQVPVKDFTQGHSHTLTSLSQ